MGSSIPSDIDEADQFTVASGAHPPETVSLEPTRPVVAAPFVTKGVHVQRLELGARQRTSPLIGDDHFSQPRSAAEICGLSWQPRDGRPSRAAPRPRTRVSSCASRPPGRYQVTHLPTVEPQRPRFVLGWVERTASGRQTSQVSLLLAIPGQGPHRTVGEYLSKGEASVRAWRSAVPLSRHQEGPGEAAPSSASSPSRPANVGAARPVLVTMDSPATEARTWGEMSWPRRR